MPTDERCRLLPEGFHGCVADDFSGWERPHGHVENPLEVELHFAEQRNAGIGQPRFTCNYCGDRFRTSVLEKGLRWFAEHDCPNLEKAEAAGIAYDLADQFQAPRLAA